MARGSPLPALLVVPDRLAGGAREAQLPRLSLPVPRHGRNAPARLAPAALDRAPPPLRTPVPRAPWLLAVPVVVPSERGYPAPQLQELIGGSYKTAWFVEHRIRAAMAG